MDVCTLVDGRNSSFVDVTNRGLAYGDGLFETIKVVNGKPVFFEHHIQRLIQSCQRLAITLDPALVYSDIDRVLKEATLSSSILKIIITRGGVGRGYRADAKGGSQRIVSVQPSFHDYRVQQHDGVAVRLSDARLGINVSLAGMKHLSRLENVLARSELQQDTSFDSLMLDADGRLVEGAMSNLFLVIAGQLYTPALHRCGVAGIVRGVIMDTLDKSCIERDCVLSDLYRAEEVFICNSLIGIVPVAAMGCHQKTIGPITRRLQQALLQEELVSA